MSPFSFLLLSINSENIAIVHFVGQKYSAIRRTPISALLYNIKTEFSGKKRVPDNRESTVIIVLH